MFEDALVESTAHIHTKARYWMIATFTFNLSVAAVAIIVPMLFPRALPCTTLTSHFALPPVPRASVPKTTQQAARQPSHSNSRVVPMDAHTAPSHIPHRISEVHDDPPAGSLVAGNVMGSGSNSMTDGIGVATGEAPVRITVKPPDPPVGPKRVSSGVMAGQILQKTQPLYPAIARAAGVQGTVVLHAIIAKDGSIQNLTVASGSEMLRNAALDAVRSWKYRPYLLSGQPTEVDTTITVNFTIGG